MTIDKTRLPANMGELPEFTPVPRLCRRHDGWTAARQRKFIAALAATGSVKAAAHRVNMTSEGAYLLRRHPEGESFRAAWEAALALGIQQLEDIAMERALHGTEVPVYSYGKLIGSRVVHNDRLLMFMLRNRAAKRFAGDRAKAMSATDKDTLRRLKREWRKDWEKEMFERQVKAEDDSARNFIAEIKAMHRRWYCTMSPFTRALYRQFRASEDADRASREAWMRAPGAQSAHEVQAEYEQWFEGGRDPRAQVSKLVDMRYWEGREEEERMEGDEA